MELRSDVTQFVVAKPKNKDDPPNGVSYIRYTIVETDSGKKLKRDSDSLMFRPSILGKSSEKLEELYKNFKNR